MQKFKLHNELSFFQKIRLPIFSIKKLNIKSFTKFQLRMELEKCTFFLKLFWLQTIFQNFFTSLSVVEKDRIPERRRPITIVWSTYVNCSSHNRMVMSYHFLFLFSSLTSIILEQPTYKISICSFNFTLHKLDNTSVNFIHSIFNFHSRTSVQPVLVKNNFLGHIRLILSIVT